MNTMEFNFFTALPPGAWIAGSLALAVLAFGQSLWSGWRSQQRHRELHGRVDEVTARLGVTDILLAETTAELSLLRQRAEQLTNRQDASAATAVRSGFRQAIALSRHGATTRQLIDTCGLSQGEAHLIQTLYGRADGAAEELH
jgi:hypothetical protein